MQVLMVVDDSESSTRAVEKVRQRTWPADVKMLVLAVAPRRLIPSPPQPMLSVLGGDWRARRDEASHARLLVQLAVESLRTSGFDVEGKVRVGSARREILREARERSADLIVIGSAKLSAPRRWLLGGELASFVVAGAPCSVEVIRPGPAPASAPPHAHDDRAAARSGRWALPSRPNMGISR